MIKTVIFDLGNVIVPLDFQRLYREMSRHAKCDDLPARVFGTGLLHAFECGQIEPEQFSQQLCAQLGMDLDYARFCELWNMMFLPDTFVPENLLESLKQRYRLLLLSNTNALHFDWIRQRYPLLRHFDAFVLSHEVGAMKPSPRIYGQAIEQARCAPEECFFTDDQPAYVEGARQAGIDAVQFQSLEQLQSEMRKRSIVF